MEVAVRGEMVEMVMVEMVMVMVEVETEVVMSKLS